MFCHNPEHLNTVVAVLCPKFFLLFFFNPSINRSIYTFPEKNISCRCLDSRFSFVYVKKIERLSAVEQFGKEFQVRIIQHPYFTVSSIRQTQIIKAVFFFHSSGEPLISCDETFNMSKLILCCTYCRYRPRSTTFSSY